jgi:transposase InsO family protein
MTPVWLSGHGWVYLSAIIDCCTRKIVGCEVSLRSRATEAVAVIEPAVAGQGIVAAPSPSYTDNGSAFTARATQGGPFTPRRRPPPRRLP